MTQEQLEYEAGSEIQAEAEFQEYHNYLANLLEHKQYKLYAIEIVLDMLNSGEFAKIGMSPKDFLYEKKRLAVKQYLNNNKNEQVNDFLFTTENLLENIDKLGPWSAYGLASRALKYYFPDAYDKDGYCSLTKEDKLIDELGCHYWQDVIVKYHIEVGYSAELLENPSEVNEL